MIVIADTSPINYLVLIGEVELLRSLYGRVLIPPAVHEEMTRPESPEAVRTWVSTMPEWLEVRVPKLAPDSRLTILGPGEREAILLGEEIQTVRILIDDAEGRQELSRRRLRFTGTIGVIAAAAVEGLVDFDLAVARLQRTNFRVSAEVIERVRRNLLQS